ncbi:MAG: RluA family pseudouridine synthase [Eubacteriales bacterium]|nr:RluA family pseudouridine synthase [Eubacteriales bacterium]
MWKGNIQDRIIYEDKALIVCHKPAGIAVQHAKMGVMDLESMLKNYLAEKGESPYLAVIHRLDQPVEGILVFAKTPAAAKELNRQLTSSQIVKEYLAVTVSNPSAENGELVDFLVKDSRTNTSKVTTATDKNGKKAILYYQILKSVNSPEDTQKSFLIKIRLKTGRHHQIRVQMANAGMPLLGDRKYNTTDKNEVSLGLCAAHLKFQHPLNKKEMDFEIQPEGNAFLRFL